MSAPDAMATDGRVGPMVAAVGRFVFRYRDYLSPVGLLLILAYARPRPFFADEGLDAWSNGIGILLGALGLAMRFAVNGLTDIQRNGENKRLAADRLVCDGIYTHSRNPLYAANALMLAGLAIICHSWLVYLLAFPLYLVAILTIVQSEEAFLRGKFGRDYDDYCRRVPRFVPRLRNLRLTMTRARFDWRRAIRREYSTAFAWSSVTLALMAWEQLSWHGASAAAPALWVLGTTWLGALGLYALARWLKKSRRLG